MYIHQWKFIQYHLHSSGVLFNTSLVPTHDTESDPCRGRFWVWDRAYTRSIKVFANIGIEAQHGGSFPFLCILNCDDITQKDSVYQRL